ncbi:hypothetical protein SDC9_00506 [bioreactor metagenome]|jgi:hypothetical protein|uniref:Uncharacterized protein n=1 Tax=bioreactor metagenome TaxID=1076179 RepID=A0A644SK74_9ZZZZ|nr:hypothetical protein [Elizabethkingia anophelis]
MKIFNISNLLFIVFTTLFLSIKAQKVDSINIKKTVINNQIQNTSLQFNIKNSTYSFNDRSDLQKNLDFLKVKNQTNPFSIPKTIYNPNGAYTPKQAIIGGLLGGILKRQ